MIAGIVRATGLFTLLIVLILYFSIGTLRGSLPQLDGAINLPGLEQTVQIERDTYGVPHIYAKNEADLQFALGYVHAQDRLWQMEMNRRIGHGRLSEIIGEPGLNIDKTMRVFGFSYAAQQSWDALTPHTKELLMAYTAGVNAVINDRRQILPPEFTILGLDMMPWKPVDTLVWQKLMWLDLSGNMAREINRAQLISKLPLAQVQTLYPTLPGEKESPLPDWPKLFDAQGVAQSLNLTAIAKNLLAEKPEGYGSNNWVVGGAQTKSGLPLLANDPHLGLTTPAIWYLAHLHNEADGSNLVGVSFPGSPSIILGRNDRMAWGFTNTSPDSQDLFIEKLVDEDHYVSPEGIMAFEKRQEHILVRGSKPVDLTVRISRHGPILSDIPGRASDLTGDGYALALSWTAIQKPDTGVEALFNLAHADTFTAFQKAGLSYLGPQQNMVYADVDGHIGYYAPGLVPIRHPDNLIAGRLPSPGWDEKYDWQGFVPYGELPTRHNPESNIIATANERIVGDDYPYYITRDWALPYRAERIRHRLKNEAPHDLDSYQDIQRDTVSNMARDVLPQLLLILEEGNLLKSELTGWDGDMSLDSPAALAFQTWLNLYWQALVQDELGDLYPIHSRPKVRLVASSLHWSHHKPVQEAPAYYRLAFLDEKSSLSWCDDKTTEAIETCTDLARQAAQKTVTKIDKNERVSGRKATWGDHHYLTQTHRPFSNIPVLNRFFALSAPQPGGTYTINVAGVKATGSGMFNSTFGPSYRGIFDLGDLDQSLFIHSTGQSGHPLSPHFDDLFPLWLAGDYIKIPTDTGGDQRIKHRLTLKPKE